MVTDSGIGISQSVRASFGFRSPSFALDVGPALAFDAERTSLAWSIPSTLACSLPGWFAWYVSCPSVGPVRIPARVPGCAVRGELILNLDSSSPWLRALARGSRQDGQRNGLRKERFASARGEHRDRREGTHAGFG